MNKQLVDNISRVQEYLDKSVIQHKIELMPTEALLYVELKGNLAPIMRFLSHFSDNILPIQGGSRVCAHITGKYIEDYEVDDDRYKPDILKLQLMDDLPF